MRDHERAGRGRSSNTPTERIGMLRSVASRALLRAAGAIAEQPYTASAPEDGSVFLPCNDADVERWNREWLRYLEVEYETKLTAHTAYPETPPLPADPRALIDHPLGASPPLGIYAHREWIEGKTILEVGCGCGNLGKLVARYAKSFLGTDYSTLALMIARLVSPANPANIHLSDRPGLTAHFETIDTAIGRYFWIHQNLELGKRVLRFIGAFVRPSGRVYADFFWPDPAGARDVKRVLPAQAALSARYPSSVFAYRLADVEQLVLGSAFRIIDESIHVPMQRRYVVLEKR